MAFDGFPMSRLKVEAVVSGPVEAAQVARLLTSLDRHFSRFARSEVGLPGVRLRVEQTGVGSWWATLMAAKELYDLGTDYPDLIPIFVNQLGQAYSSLTNQEISHTPEHMRDLVRDLAKSGKAIKASAIEISDIFTGAAVSLTERDYESILSTPKGFRDPFRGSSAKIAEEPRPVAIDWALEEAGKLAAKGTLFGTTFLVDRTWYVRADGMHGVLLPLQTQNIFSDVIEQGRSYSFGGDVVRSPEGFPIAIAVTHMSPL